MSALFDWIDTPGLLGDVLLLAFFAAIYLVAARILITQKQKRPEDHPERYIDWL